jgi:lipoprotein-anchoring transpeptidase ErfK/SrfK
VVDKSDFRIYLVEDGLCIKSYPIAVGALGMTTPNAYWRIDAKYYTDPTSVYGPRKMRMFRQSGGSYVYTAYAVHGTNNEASIGTRASHGCIRLYNRDVIELFDMVPLGTMVVTRD